MAKNQPIKEQEGEVVASDLEPAAAPEGAVAPESPAPAAAPADTDKSAPSFLKVIVPGNVPNGPLGGSVRTFSAQDHGNDFKKVAEVYRVRFNGEYVA